MVCKKSIRISCRASKNALLLSCTSLQGQIPTLCVPQICETDDLPLPDNMLSDPLYQTIQQVAHIYFLTAYFKKSF